ncbi:60S ribosomal protein L13A [Blastocystis sp. ATCC 50177/Nand II]|uniref:60S ribosomal protein L13A n=1 Tax=Blastocystis sp. subtype 1 (strain ATCC 50177 / NandII) TaxID=478820 RepID=A0A196S9I7_BLAHN|nr:60S ribosomal protein L13A [Blastocystis sp. ATCC 50177/Nand II]
MFEKEVVIDCRGHTMGRLASIVAKELLSGQKVVCVRCEDLNVTGSMMRNFIRRKAFFHKKMNTNPARGAYHERATPPRSSSLPRGGEALSRLRCFEGCPAPYDKVKKMVVPAAYHPTAPTMVPHKLPRGGEALSRLRCFEGCPAPYDKVKKMVVPAAYRVSNLRPDRAYVVLGDLAQRFGWKHQDLVKRLEAKRLAEAKEYYQAKKTSA